MGGYQVPNRGSGDDGFDEEGYDESQRAEILEVTRSGPTDGAILTDIPPDLAETDDDLPEDELSMEEGERGEESADVRQSERDMNEDDLQNDFDEDALGDPGEMDDSDDAALSP